MELLSKLLKHRLGFNVCLSKQNDELEPPCTRPGSRFVSLFLAWMTFGYSTACVKLEPVSTSISTPKDGIENYNLN